MEKMLRRVYENAALTRVLKIVSHIVVVCAFAQFLAYIVLCYNISWKAFAVAAATTGAAFFIVSAIRGVLNAPRPYDIYSFYEQKPKARKGGSFPSRHAFSVFCVAVSSFPILPASASVLLVLGGALCACRVLLGIHFIRDCVAGAAIGVVSGTITAIVVNLTL